MRVRAGDRGVTVAPFLFRHKIRFSHCDPAGFLYFPHFFDIVNAAVEDWFEAGLGMPFHAFHLQHGYGNPVVSTHCEFLGDCRFGEELALELAPTRIGRSSIRMRLVARVAGEERMRVQHATAMTSLETQRSVEIPAALRAQAERFLLVAEAGAARAPAPGDAPANAFGSRQLVRYSHCDPGGFVYFARFFDLFNSVLEDWFADGLACPWGPDLMGTRKLRLRPLSIGGEFLRACRMGEALQFDLWLERLDRSSIALALAGRVAGEARMRVAWTLSMVSIGSGKQVPIPADLRARMERFGARREERAKQA